MKNKYNKDWKVFFNKVNITKEDVFNQVEKLAQKYGFKLNIFE